MKCFQSLLTKIWTCCLLLTLCGSALAQTLSSTVNRNQIGGNETVSLKIIYDQQIDSNALDLSTLEKDFEILSMQPQSSSSISVINGSTSRVASTTWNLVIAPKRQGRLTIPAFELEGASSKPITISVLSEARANPSNSPLSAEVSVDSQNIVMGKPVIVHIELSAAGNVGNLNGPELIVKDAQVELLNQESFQRVDNGVARQIVRLSYAVSADNSGTLTVPVMTYTGVRGGSRSVFGPRGEQVIARTRQVNINVEPAQTKAGAQWLPANSVTLKREWLGDLNDVAVGEPITRSITIKAEGQRSAALPPIKYAQNQQIKVYSDQPQLREEKSASGITAYRTESQAIVPNQAGELVLPPVSIDWWDVNTRQWRTATLASETLSVKEASNELQLNQPMPTQASDSDGVPLLDAQTQNSKWVWATLLLAAICIVQAILLIYMWLRPKSQKSVSARAQTEKSAWTKLKKTISAGSTKQIREALENWLWQLSPSARNTSLHEFAIRNNAIALGAQIKRLDAELYGNDDNFCSASLLKALEKFRSDWFANSHSSPESSSLRPLYPNKT